MTNHRHPADNSPDTTEGPRAGVAQEGAKAEEEKGGVKQGDEAESPPPHRRRDQQHDLHEATGNGAETDAEEEDDNEEGERDGETPRGHM